jgi:methylenetetrahydrofolate--tRNA-(uracil-5-)-methyltransferase
MSIMSNLQIQIVGGGLAGSEAAHFLARNGVKVALYEMRPAQMTEAHKTHRFAELVCSNSLKSKAVHSAPGILKAEMAALDSLILKCAATASLPGGEALVVDRDVFSEAVTQSLKSHPNITLFQEEVTAPFPEITLIATGPLTSEKLSQWIAGSTGTEDLYFYDAISPIVDASTIDTSQTFLANRYGKGGEDAYLNCPLSEMEYNTFYEALIKGEKVPPKNFEKEKFFQACQPIEAIAATGKDSLRFGPMKPVGLDDPRTGRRPYAVVQLRAENAGLTAYNLVGFQTKLKYGDQLKVLKMIPALRNAEFFRLGSIHRNTYVCGPKVLRSDLSLKGSPRVYLAGQITGVEGYLESSACGLLAGLFILQRIKGQPHQAPPANTALGALLRFIIGSKADRYEPSNIHFGLFEPTLYDGLTGKSRDESRSLIADQSYKNFSRWAKQTDINLGI